MYRMNRDEFEALKAQVEARLGDFEVDMSDRATMVRSINRIFEALAQDGLAEMVGREPNGQPLYQLTGRGKAYLTWLQATGGSPLLPGTETKGSA